MTSTAKKQADPKDTFTPPERNPYPVGSVLRVSTDSKTTLSGKTVVVMRYLEQLATYQAHEKGNKMRSGYVHLRHITGAEYIAPDDTPATRPPILHVPASEPPPKEKKAAAVKVVAPEPPPAPDTTPPPFDPSTLAFESFVPKPPTVKRNKHIAEISFNKATMGLNRLALEALGFPLAVKLDFSRKGKVVAVTAADIKDRAALKLVIWKGKSNEPMSASISTHGFYRQFGLQPQAKPIRRPAYIVGKRVMAQFPD